jgi:hypothetical protein
MGFVAEIDQETAQAGALPAAGSGDFPPLTQGKYQARVTKVEGVADFGGTGDNSKKKVVKIRVDILEDSPNGAKRVYFPRIPLFTKFASGKDATAFGGFWRDAIGWPQEKLLAGDMPGPEDILGKQITITLSAPKAPDDYNPLGYNEVSFFSAAGDINATPTAPVKAAWLTAEGKLNPDWAPPVAGAPAAQQAPATPPAWGAPAPAAAPVNDVWAPNAADVSYAQQAVPA